MTNNKAANELAKNCASSMLDGDAVTKDLNISLETISAGTATMAMTVTENMLNGYQTCHGGFIFTLADSAFAFACNSYNKTTVAAAADISFVQMAFEKDILTAHATEQYKTGRNGIYDVKVTNQHGETIALFRGKSRTIAKTGPLDDQKTS